MYFASLNYLRSVFTLLRGVRNLPAVLWALLWRPRREDRAFLVRLASGYRFLVRSALDVWVLKEVILDREYEQIGPAIQAGWTVVDIGAAYGEFCIPAMRRSVDGRVIAIEPAPDTHALLLENLRLNAAEGIECHALAIGREDGSAQLNYAARGAVMNSTATSGQTTRSVVVPMLSLETFFAQQGIDHCDYLKIDCEGGEYEILLAAPDTTLQRIDNICLEYHESGLTYTHHDLCKHLEQAGFTVVSRANPADQHQGWIYARRDQIQ